MGFFDKIRSGLRSELDELMKADSFNDVDGEGDNIPEKSNLENQNKGSIDQKGMIEDPYYDQVSQHFVFKTKGSRLSNRTLKETSLKDWLISAIIQNRVDTMMAFCKPQAKKFDMGYRFVKRDTHGKNLTKEDKQNIANLEDFVFNCGRKANTPPGDEMLFPEFVKLIVRDALTFGHVAIEKVFTRSGAIHRLRPLPAESMYLVNKRSTKELIESATDAAYQEYNNQLNGEKNDREKNFADVEQYKYVQMSQDMKVLAAFGDEDLIWMLYNPQNFADSNGYCYGPLELAIVNTTNHMNVELYNANFFTHGYAARGILHLKGTVTQSQLTAFRRQFYSTISGSHNAWRTPIISGLDDVQWVQLSGNAKEMEYLNYNNHLMRAICSQFQIDPVELGLDYLVSATGKAPAGQQSNEDKIMFSRERGLYPIFMMIENIINGQVIPHVDPELASKYVFKFVGYDDETPQTHVAQAQAEMTTYASLNDLLHGAGKERIEHVVADLPINESFWTFVERNMTRGEIREFFFGDKGASQKRELQYLPGDQAFLAWQQQLMALDQTKDMKKQQQAQAQAEQQQAEAQADAQAHQQALDEAEHHRQQEQHELAMGEAKARHAKAATQQRDLADIIHDTGVKSKVKHVDGKPIKSPLDTFDE